MKRRLHLYSLEPDVYTFPLARHLSDLSATKVARFSAQSLKHLRSKEVVILEISGIFTIRNKC